MKRSIPHARRMNLIALALLLTGLISLIAFHLLVFIDHRPTAHALRGWQLWSVIWSTIKSPDFDDIQTVIVTSTFLTNLLLVAGAPFSIPVFRLSRLAWWLAATVSGLALFGLSGLLLMIFFDAPEKLGAGFYCLIASQILNFLGLLFIRREVPAGPEVDPA